MGIRSINHDKREMVFALAISFLLHLSIIYLCLSIKINSAKPPEIESIQIEILSANVADTKSKLADNNIGSIRKHKNIASKDTFKQPRIINEKIKSFGPYSTADDKNDLDHVDNLSNDLKNQDKPSTEEMPSRSLGQLLGGSPLDRLSHTEGEIGSGRSSSGKVAAYGDGTQSSLTGNGSSGSGLASSTDGGTKDGLQDYRFIREAVLKGLRYPDRARLNGIEGVVILSFIVTKHAKIKDIKIIKSSGSNILDNAAKEAVAHASLNHPFKHDITIQLPVAFRLK